MPLAIIYLLRPTIFFKHAQMQNICLKYSKYNLVKLTAADIQPLMRTRAKILPSMAIDGTNSGLDLSFMLRLKRDLPSDF